MDRFKTVVLYNQIELENEEANIEPVPMKETNAQASLGSLEDSQQRTSDDDWSSITDNNLHSEDNDFIIELKKE